MFFCPFQFCFYKAFDSTYFYPSFGVSYLLHCLSNLDTFSLVPLVPYSVTYHSKLFCQSCKFEFNIIHILLSFIEILMHIFDKRISHWFVETCAVYGQAYKHNHYFHGLLQSSFPIQNEFLCYQVDYNETCTWLSFVTNSLRNIKNTVLILLGNRKSILCTVKLDPILFQMIRGKNVIWDILKYRKHITRNFTSPVWYSLKDNHIPGIQDFWFNWLGFTPKDIDKKKWKTL